MFYVSSIVVRPDRYIWLDRETRRDIREFLSYRCTLRQTRRESKY